MTDLRKSYMLRGFLWACFMIGALSACVIADAVIYQFAKKAFDADSQHVIEIAVFLCVVSTKIWRWLTTRVWVGTQSRVPN